MFWAAVLMAAALVGAGPTSIAGAEDAQAKQRGLWPAGEVGRGTGYVKEGGSQRVREVQRRLRDLGLRPGPVDGLFGPRTEAATKRLQRREGLKADGIVGRRTLSRLRAAARRRPVSREERSSSERPAPRVERDRPALRDPAPAPPPAPAPAPPSVVGSEPSSGGKAGLLRWIAALFVAAALLAGAALLAPSAGRRRPARDTGPDDRTQGSGAAAPSTSSPEAGQPPAPTSAERREGRFVRHERTVSAIGVGTSGRPLTDRRGHGMAALRRGAHRIRRRSGATKARRWSRADELAALSTLIRAPKPEGRAEAVDRRSSAPEAG